MRAAPWRWRAQRSGAPATSPSRSTAAPARWSSTTPGSTSCGTGRPDSDPARYGLTRIRAEHQSHPYAADWWPIGQGVGYGSTFANQVADLLEGWPDGTLDPRLRPGRRVQAVCEAMEHSATQARWINLTEIAPTPTPTPTPTHPPPQPQPDRPPPPSARRPSVRPPSVRPPSVRPPPARRRRPPPPARSPLRTATWSYLMLLAGDFVSNVAVPDALETARGRAALLIKRALAGMLWPYLVLLGLPGAGLRLG